MTRGQGFMERIAANHERDRVANARNADLSADPAFAAIAEHKALIRKAGRREAAARAARDKAEKEHGEWTRAPKPGEWLGEAAVSPFYAGGTTPGTPRAWRLCEWPGRSR
jgi:hypothetical protein